ncbi:FAD/NAD-P-binding domain-containing protein [Lentinus brumalis]|uniref:FAD/NAD-P-binding domain-containing protein n=1 Tax=Lentinus brumalis TaxID=2498619 RepID=A0A371CZP3_9APHY|nr:FAD/NAD-P-binding domain-containing protein [Polyporus brumalis]
MTTSQNYARYISPSYWSALVFNFFYVLVQHVIIWLFKPPPPPSPECPRNPKGRIAVIGAGLTGVSSAAHAIAHGFDVVIYEQDNKIGGIWAHVNKTSGLQLNSLLYRFHPAVLWSCTFPHRDEILSEIRRIWKEYQLEPRTRLNTPVTSVKRVPGTREQIQSDPAHSQSKWIINNGEDGEFDAVVVTIGTCGAPMRIKFPGMPQHDDNTSDHGSEKHEGDNEEVFQGEVIHSSELDNAQLEGKNIVVIGSGASGVEAVETALEQGAKHCTILARDDKWIIPRNIVLDTLIAAQPFGREMPLSFIWEKIIAAWNYRGARELVPAHLGIFESTPVVNDEFIGQVKRGQCDYVRCDIQRLTKDGVRVKVRGREAKPGEGKEEKEIKGDVVVLATGFKKPEISFFKDELFPEGYERPNLYLQNFSTEDWSILMTNSSYQNAIGTVGHFHIGIYMRILLTFLMDPDARPTPKDMKLWVDVIRFVKSGARGGALSFFTYMELTIWLLLFHVFRLDRLKWVFFIMQGWGVYPAEYKAKNPKTETPHVKFGSVGSVEPDGDAVKVI